METGYDLEPRPLGRTGHRRVGLVIVAIVLFLAVVLLKPWVGPPAPSTTERLATPEPAASPGVFAVVPLAPQADPSWPAASIPSTLADATASQAEGVLGALSVHSGTWGVGDAGVGPRMLRDEPWTDWVALIPETVDAGPLHVLTWPGTDACGGFPQIYDQPSLVAVTAPPDLAPDWRLTGWWTDGYKVAGLEGSVRQVSPAGNRGISYLERTDRAPWPAGRYEFHVIVGQRTVALTVCVTRRG